MSDQVTPPTPKQVREHKRSAGQKHKQMGVTPVVHKLHRVGWLRAAVLGANDGIVSTASLVVGVAAAHTDKHQIFLSGMAGLVAGAMSMAAGEYVSVSSQSDLEKADLEIEKQELKAHPAYELQELTDIYIERGLDDELARQVAKQLTAKDALATHARDELGITDVAAAKPVQAAVASASSFTGGAIIPVLMVRVSSVEHLILTVSATSLFMLTALGVLGAYAGGASLWKGALRVLVWGAIAIAATAGIGALFGAAVS